MSNKTVTKGSINSANHPLHVQEDKPTGRFRVGDLFDISTGSIIDSSKLIEHSDKDKNTDRISVSSFNNGVSGSYSNELNKELTTAENFISVNFMGNVFYHEEECSVEMKVHILKNEHLNKQTALYLTSVLSKLFEGQYGYGNQLSSGKLKNEPFYMELPINLDNPKEPDYDYMEQYIKNIERTYVQNLQSKNDLEIENLKALCSTDSLTYLEQHKLVDFRVGELFEKDKWYSIRQAKSQSDVRTSTGQNSINYVVQSLENNMVSRRVDIESAEQNNHEILSGNRLVLGVTLPAVSYQKEQFTGSQLITLDLSRYSERVGLYLLTCFKKHNVKFSYDNKPSLSKYKDLIIKLPANPINPKEPDWDLMEEFIAFVEKNHRENIAEVYENELERTYGGFL